MRVFFLFCLLSVSLSVRGQLDNSAFDQRLKFPATDSSSFYAGINLLAFGKNNEYFDTTIEGYTLFGYQFNPYLTYFFQPNIRLDAGAYLQQDFGNNEFSTIAPTLSLKIKHKNFSFTIGTLEGSLHHQLIEPLYDFERVLVKRLENGIQFQWMKDGLFADGWVNWEKMIYFNDPNQERFVAGISLNKRLLSKNRWTLEVPLQLTVRHAGGQINNSSEPLASDVTGAAGLSLKKEWTGFITAAGIKSYYVTYGSLTSRTVPYKDGNGMYVNPYLQTRWGLGLMGTYWYGSEYLTTDGNQLFPVTTEFLPEVIHQPRVFYMLRILYDLKITEGLKLTARVEPFFDTYPNTIQYSYGFYLNFSNSFFLGHAKKK